MSYIPSVLAAYYQIEMNVIFNENAELDRCSLCMAAQAFKVAEALIDIIIWCG